MCLTWLFTVPTVTTSSSAIAWLVIPVATKRTTSTFVSEGDELATWGHQVFKRIETGEEFAADFAHIITMRDGKWLHFRDFTNTALAAEVFSR